MKSTLKSSEAGENCFWVWICADISFMLGLLCGWIHAIDEGLRISRRGWVLVG